MTRGAVMRASSTNAWSSASARGGFVGVGTRQPKSFAPVAPPRFPVGGATPPGCRAMAARPPTQTCPLGRQGVAASAFDEHLPPGHRLVPYRSVRRSSRETLETVLGDLLTAKPAQDAW